MLVPVDTLSKSFGVRPAGVLHVGAHEAEEWEDYQRFGWGPVIWVEMLPEKAELLRTRFAADKDTMVINAACWDEDGERLPLFRADNGQSSSLLPPDHHLTAHPTVSFRAEDSIVTSRLDSVLPKHPAFDFVNFDIQGAELRAMKGLGSRLSEVSWAYLEINRKPLYAGCALLPDLDKFLAERGFYRVVLRMAGDSGWGDALYANARKLGFAKILVLRAKGVIFNLRQDLSGPVQRLTEPLSRVTGKMRRLARRLR
jgi:FkbM family methyltransferase